MKYGHIVRAVSETPWAIRPERLAAILDLVAYRAAGHRLTPAQIEARVGGGAPARQVVTAGSVAVIPLTGVLVPRAGLMTQVSGATSVAQFSEALRGAAADPGVDAILIDIDSPGGMVDLVPETAARIREAREAKPVVAIANTDAASAAFWLAAQASELVVSASGTVGSIGVFAAHDDISASQEMRGVKTTLISAGRYKTEGNPFEPLTDEAHAAIQGRVDEFYGMFIRDVASGRGVSENAVREGFGEGRVVTARDALSLGMVDRIDTFEATLDRVARGAAADQAARRSGPAAWSPTVEILSHEATHDRLTEAADRGLSFGDEAEALRAGAAHLATRTASLAEVERGHLTVAKREHLSACTEELRESVEALDGLLADTDPNKRPADPVLRERARYERQRANL